MTDRTGDVLHTFPPRPPNPDERALVNEWLAATCNIASAYVSERRTDDPAMYRRIAVTVGPQCTPSYLIHAPAGTSCWLVSSIGHGSEVKCYDSLKSALNSIRDVFVV
jgi:hypothetical protein